MTKRLARQVNCRIHAKDWDYQGGCDVIGSVVNGEVTLRIENGIANWPHMTLLQCRVLQRFLDRAVCEIGKRSKGEVK